VNVLTEILEKVVQSESHINRQIGDEHEINAGPIMRQVPISQGTV
jgi:hypothetical protein